MPPNLLPAEKPYSLRPDSANATLQGAQTSLYKLLSGFTGTGVNQGARGILRSMRWGLTTSPSGQGQEAPRTRKNVAPDSSGLVIQAKFFPIFFNTTGSTLNLGK